MPEPVDSTESSISPELHFRDTTTLKKEFEKADALGIILDNEKESAIKDFREIVEKLYKDNGDKNSEDLQIQSVDKNGDLVTLNVYGGDVIAVQDKGQEIGRLKVYASRKLNGQSGSAIGWHVLNPDSKFKYSASAEPGQSGLPAKPEGKTYYGDLDRNMGYVRGSLTDFDSQDLPSPIDKLRELTKLIREAKVVKSITE